MTHPPHLPLQSASRPSAPAPLGAATAGADPYRPYRATGPTSTTAIVAFVLAFLLPLVGAICGHVAVSQIRRSGERGFGLAVAAIVVGYGLALVEALVLLALVVSGAVALGVFGAVVGAAAAA